MNGIGDTHISSERKWREELETEESEKHPGHYKRNLLINAQKSFTFLEQRSEIHFIEADDEYIISAGIEHDINIWDAVEGKHIRRLYGHTAPITGLHLLVPEVPRHERTVVSASKDKSIRKWSLCKGEELSTFETDNIITCMGVMNKSLAVSGNHKGYIEIRHLETGDLYASIFAHDDAVDAIAVEGNYACSTTFVVNSCIKVWEIQFEATACIYRIEISPNMAFSSLAMWQAMVFLGDSGEHKLHVINFETNEKGTIDMRNSKGSVLNVRVWNEWILSCSECNREVVLDVYRIHNYEHFGSFPCFMEQVYATAAIESDSSLRIVLGGSALVVLSFDFILTQDTRVSFEKSVVKPNYTQNKSKTHYTLKNIADEPELKSDPQSNNNNHNSPNADSDVKSMTRPVYSPLSYGEHRSYENEETINNLRQKFMSVLTEDPSTQIPSDMEKKLIELGKIRLQKMAQTHEEPRAAAKKLEKLLDENKQYEELEKCFEDHENCKQLEETGIFSKKQYTKMPKEILDETDKKTEESGEKLDEANSDAIIDRSLNLTNKNIDSNTENEGSENEISNDKNSKNISKFLSKKKGKTDMKKSPEKVKHRKCTVM